MLTATWMWLKLLGYPHCFCRWNWGKPWDFCKNQRVLPTLLWRSVVLATPSCSSQYPHPFILATYAHPSHLGQEFRPLGRLCRSKNILEFGWTILTTIKNPKSNCVQPEILCFITSQIHHFLWPKRLPALFWPIAIPAPSLRAALSGTETEASGNSRSVSQQIHAVWISGPYHRGS